MHFVLFRGSAKAPSYLLRSWLAELPFGPSAKEGLSLVRLRLLSLVIPISRVARRSPFGEHELKLTLPGALQLSPSRRDLPHRPPPSPPSALLLVKPLRTRGSLSRFKKSTRQRARKNWILCTFFEALYRYFTQNLFFCLFLLFRFVRY